MVEVEELQSKVMCQDVMLALRYDAMKPSN